MPPSALSAPPPPSARPLRRASAPGNPRKLLCRHASGSLLQAYYCRGRSSTFAGPSASSASAVAAADRAHRRGAPAPGIAQFRPPGVHMPTALVRPAVPPRPMSLVEAAIRLRADDVGQWTPSSLPAGVSKWVPFLLRREWRSALELRTVAAGLDLSFFVDANGALLADGREEAGQVGVLGLGGGTSQYPLRRWCRRPCRPWREFASGLWFATRNPTSP
jgi:hypothetical protein